MMARGLCLFVVVVFGGDGASLRHPLDTAKRHIEPGRLAHILSRCAARVLCALFRMDGADARTSLRPLFLFSKRD